MMLRRRRRLVVGAAAVALVVSGLEGGSSLAASASPMAVEPSAAAADPNLESGERLTAGQSLRAGRYRVTMQADGNLVEYGDLAVYEQPARVYWQTRTAGNPGAYAVMQTDGNLVVYSRTGRALWQSRTAGHPGTRAALVTNGNFSLYGNFPPTPVSPGNVRPLGLGGGVVYDWKLTAGGTMRTPDRLQALMRPLELLMQSDGNLVLRTEVRRDDYFYELLGHKPYWQSRTSGHPGAYAVMQGDGNLVVHAPSGRALWSSGTAGNPGAHLDLQSDGNLVIRSRSGAALWQTGTAGVAAPVLVK